MPVRRVSALDACRPELEIQPAEGCQVGHLGCTEVSELWHLEEELWHLRGLRAATILKGSWTEQSAVPRVVVMASVGFLTDPMLALAPQSFEARNASAEHHAVGLLGVHILCCLHSHWWHSA